MDSSDAQATVIGESEALAKYPVESRNLETEALGQERISIGAAVR